MKTWAKIMIAIGLVAFLLLTKGSCGQWPNA